MSPSTPDAPGRTSTGRHPLHHERPWTRAAVRRVAAGATGVAMLLGGGLTSTAYAADSTATESTTVAPTTAEPLARGLIIKTKSAGVSVRALAAATAQAVDDVSSDIESDVGIGPAIEGTMRLFTFAEPLTVGEAEDAAADVEQRIDVEWAVPDLPRRALTTPVIPNDTLFDQQWDMWDAAQSNGGYSVKAPLLWGTTTGSADVVVAVIDTGITDHPDLNGQLVPGYDFVSDAAMGNDGDGRDPDPADPGDWVSQADVNSGRFGSYCDSSWISSSSWHGTHVAGTIAAIQDNSYGISGVAPGVKVQAVRALGKCGGYDFDIAAAVTWAVGGSVSGVPDNATPANVVNLSLGGEGDCLASYRQAIDIATDNGAVLVVAAGNESSPMINSAPANCPGVISVAASTKSGGLAPYSNYGTSAASPTLAAPGGSYSVDGGIESTFNSGGTVPGSPTFNTYQGTSMAAPHVAGAAALAYSLGISGTQNIVDTMTASVQPFPFSAGCTTTRCGAGILDLSQLAVAAPPGAPYNLVHQQDSDSTVTMSWTAPSTGATPTGYQVQRSTNDGATWTDETVTTGTSATLTLEPGVGYRFRVAATSAAGLGAWSLPTDVITLREISEPGAPEDITVKPGNGRVTVSWSPPADTGGTSLSNYVVTADPGRHLCATASLSCTITGLDNGRDYTVSVTASNTAGLTSAASAQVISTPRTTPGPVRSVTVTYKGSGKYRTAVIRWSAPSDDGGATVTKYKARAKKGSGSYGSWAYTSKRVVKVDVRNGKVYTVQIAARNAAGYGDVVKVKLKP